MLREKITCLIFSCDKFSDLWDGNLKMFNKNWPDHDFDIYIVSDKETDRQIDGVTILCPGADVEWTDRLKYALHFVTTEYVLLTLDDYFLIKPVKSEIINRYIQLMDDGEYDYLRLFKRPKAATRNVVDGFDGVYHVDNSVEYSVNLYTCIWRKEFLAYTVKEPRNAWNYEITLHESAVSYKAHCLVSYNDDFVILDVVRKGKILRNANRYFKKHPGIYTGNRSLQSISFETKLWFKTMAARYTPSFLVNIVRKIYLFFGGTSFAKTH